MVIFDPATGKKSWELLRQDGETALDHPSLARELPDTGDHRGRRPARPGVVIDRQTKKIIWQYGQTRHQGPQAGPAELPDGFDLDVPRLEERTAEPYCGSRHRLMPVNQWEAVMVKKILLGSGGAQANGNWCWPCSSRQLPGVERKALIQAPPEKILLLLTELRRAVALGSTSTRA